MSQFMLRKCFSCNHNNFFMFLIPTHITVMTFYYLPFVSLNFNLENTVVIVSYYDF